MTTKPEPNIYHDANTVRFCSEAIVSLIKSQYRSMLDEPTTRRRSNVNAYRVPYIDITCNVGDGNWSSDDDYKTFAPKVRAIAAAFGCTTVMTQFSDGGVEITLWPAVGMYAPTDVHS